MSSIVKESRLSCYAFGGILLVKWIFVAIILLCVTPERSLLTCLLHPTFKRLFDISIDFSKFFAFIYCVFNCLACIGYIFKVVHTDSKNRNWLMMLTMIWFGINVAFFLIFFVSVVSYGINKFLNDFGYIFVVFIVESGLHLLLLAATFHIYFSFDRVDQPASRTSTRRYQNQHNDSTGQTTNDWHSTPAYLFSDLGGVDSGGTHSGGDFGASCDSGGGFDTGDGDD